MQQQGNKRLFTSNTQKPKYAQIQDNILKKIRDRIWASGDQIPSERKLAELHQASVGTVRHALQALVDQGYLFRNQGRGTFITASTAQTDDSLRYYRLSRGFGKEISALTIRSLKKPKKCVFEKASEKMGLDHDQDYYKYDRVFLLDSEPVALVISYLPTDLFAGFDSLSLQVLDEFPLYVLVENKYSMPALETKEGFSAVVADSHIAEILMIPLGSPVLRIEMLVATNGNVYYEYRESYCVTSERQIIRDWGR